jgi:FkbM family methyltransferase
MIKSIKKFLKKPPSELELDQDIMDVITKITPNTIETVFDIGAHHGRYSDLIRKNFNGAKLYLFEPFIKSFQFIEEKYKATEIVVENLAISDTEDILKFYSNVLDETNSLLPANITNTQIDELTKPVEILNVKVSTLNNYCKEKLIEKIDLLKIDTQGNTLNVLKGADRLLKKGLIGIIQCEVEFIQIYKNQSLFFHVATYLESFGYELYSLYNLHYDIDGRLSWADAVYLKIK